MTDSPSKSTDGHLDRDQIEIPAGRTAAGRVRVPSSKSLTHRWLNLALLARRPLTLERPLLAEDTRLFLAGLGRCGFRVDERGDDVFLDPGEASPEGSPTGESPEIEIFCGNAGTMLRFLVATLTVVPGRWRLDGIPRLRERPVRPLVDALRRLGARIDYLGAEGYVPLRIEGASLQAGTTLLDAGESSQYLSAVLMAALRAPGEVTVEVTSLTSGPYIDVTLGVAEAAGGRIERLGPMAWRVHPSDLKIDRARVEGDWSAAAYPAAAAALTRGRVVLEGLEPASRQGDRGFLDLLLKMGAEADWRNGELEVRGTGRLIGLEADLSGMPDQVPTLAALGPWAEGETRIVNVAHLRIKESDRLEAMATELRKLGAEVDEGPDSLRIPGHWSNTAPPTHPVLIDPRGDHRIAMALALAGLRRPGVTIGAPHVVAKSYPGFWGDLERLLG